MKMVLAILNSDDASHRYAKPDEGRLSDHLAVDHRLGFLAGGQRHRADRRGRRQAGSLSGDHLKYSKSRKQLIPSSAEAGISFYPSMPVEVDVGGAAHLRAQDVEQF